MRPPSARLAASGAHGGNWLSLRPSKLELEAKLEAKLVIKAKALGQGPNWRGGLMSLSNHKHPPAVPSILDHRAHPGQPGQPPAAVGSPQQA